MTYNDVICSCGHKVEQLVFKSDGAFTTWIGNGLECQACVDARMFVKWLKK